MRHLAVMGLLAAVGASSLVAASTLGRADDDLAVVRKAVARPAARPKAARPAVAPASPAPAASEPAPRPRTGRDPQWFKVRVVDKATGHRKVTINLPLSLVRVLGDEPIDWGCREREEGEHARCSSLRISDVLRSLEAGQELVEIDDEEATVRVWVE